MKITQKIWLAVMIAVLAAGPAAAEITYPTSELWIETPDGYAHTYEIIDLDVVDAQRSALLLDSDEPMLTLVTCYPFDSTDTGGPLRYVVTARKKQ